MTDSNQNPLKLHDLRPAPSSKTARTRVGRGEASKGKTAGRGTKGTKARKPTCAIGFEGGQMPYAYAFPEAARLHQPLPRRVPGREPVGPAGAVPPRAALSRSRILVFEGAVRKNQPVKVLATGEVNVKLDITAQKFSASAEKKIAAAGGSVTTARVSFDGAPSRENNLCCGAPSSYRGWSDMSRDSRQTGTDRDAATAVPGPPGGKLVNSSCARCAPPS